MKTSVIIPVYLQNQDFVDMTEYMAIAGLIHNMEGNDLEVVVVDDMSPLPHAAGQIADRARAAGLDTKVIRNQQNLGFSKSVNKGVAAASGHYILVMNNDIYLPKNVIKKLREHLEKYNLGLVGPMLSNNNGYIAQEVQCPKFISDYHQIDYSEIEKFSNQITSRHPQTVIDVNFLIGACMLTTKSIWNQVGGLNTVYGKGYYEEVDLQVQYRHHGYKLGIARDIFVIHDSKTGGSPSFSLNKLKRKYLLSKNSFLFWKLNGFRENWQLQFDWQVRTTWSTFDGETFKTPRLQLSLPVGNDVKIANGNSG